MPQFDPLSPTVQLTTPYIPPANAFAALTVDDMVSMQVPYGLDWTYEVGKQPMDFKIGVLVGNKCLDNELRISMTYPDYLIPDAPFPFILPPLTIYNIGFSLNEAVAKDKVVTGQRIFSENFTVTTEILNVSGPVYVKSKL